MGPRNRCMVVITVVMMISVMGAGCTDSGSSVGSKPEKPDILVVQSKDQSIYWLNIFSVRYNSSDRDSVNQNDTMYRLMDGGQVVTFNGAEIEGVACDIRDSVGVGLRDPVTGNITNPIIWREIYSDLWEITAGDFFLIPSTYYDEWNGTDAEPGYATPGMIFELVFIPTGEVMVSVELG